MEKKEVVDMTASQDLVNQMKKEYLWKKAYFEAGWIVYRCKNEKNYEHFAMLYKPSSMDYYEWYECMETEQGSRLWWLNIEIEKNLNKSLKIFSNTIDSGIRLEEKTCLVAHISRWKYESKGKEIPLLIDLSSIGLNTLMDNRMACLGKEYESNPDMAYLGSTTSMNWLKKDALDFVTENWEAIECVKNALIYKGYLTPSDVEHLVKYKDLTKWESNYQEPVINSSSFNFLIALENLDKEIN